VTLGPDTVTVKNAPLATDPRDRRQYRDWANSVDTEVTGCFVQPFLLSTKLQVEYTLDREFANTFFQLFMPYDVDVTAESRIEFDGKTYEVQGHPGKWRDFEGNHDHIELVMKLREG
jgi:hypothetical protein